MSHVAATINARYSTINVWRFLLGVLAACFILLLPARQANAMSPFEALDKVCKEVDPLCGSYNSYKAVATSCFEQGDELKCAVAIIGIAGGSQAPDGIKQIDAIVECAQKGLPIGGACSEALK